MLPNRQEFEYIWILTVKNLNPNRQEFEYIWILTRHKHKYNLFNANVGFREALASTVA